MPDLFRGPTFRRRFGLWHVGPRNQSGVTIRLRSGLIPAFLLENIRRALVPREQIGTVLGRDETLQRMNPREQPDEVVLMAVLKRKNRVDQDRKSTRLNSSH